MSLISWWKFDNDLIDSIGGNNFTQPSGTIVFISGGYLNQAYTSNAVTYAIAPLSSIYNFTGSKQITFDAWVKPTFASSPPINFSFNNSGGTTLWYIRVAGTNTSIGTPAQVHTYPSGMQTSNWYHIVVKYNNGINTVFLDDVEVLATSGVVDTGPGTINSCSIIMDPDILNWYIDELKIYDDIGEVPPVTPSSLFNNTPLRPIISNKRISPYRLGSPDVVNIGVKLLNSNRLYRVKNIPIEFLIDYPTEWTVFASGYINNGVTNLYRSCDNITEISNCRGYSRALINGNYYNSNIIRLNFISSPDYTQNTVVEIPNEIVVFEGEYFTF